MLNSIFTLLLRDFKLLSIRNKGVSFAKSQVLKLETLGKYLMQMENNNGPRTEPCGAPHEILCFLDGVLLIETNYFLLVKQFLIIFREFPLTQYFFIIC